MSKLLYIQTLVLNWSLDRVMVKALIQITLSNAIFLCQAQRLLLY